MALVTVAKAGEIKPGEAKVVEAGGLEIAVFNVNGTFAAIENTCCHRGGPLGEGDLEGTIVTCPWHGWQFDVTTGACIAPKAGARVKKFEVKVDGGEVKVEL
jgi:nitrite reductase/ring-hydroxylating ferredoxin subunit